MNIDSVVFRTRIRQVVLLLACVGLVACGEQRITTPGGPDGGDDNNSPDAGSPDTRGDGGSDTDSETDGGDPFDDECLQTDADDARDFVDDYSTSLCERMLECEENSKVAEFVSIGGWDSVETCAHDVQSETLTGEQAAQAVEDDAVRLDSCNAPDCLDGIDDLDCLAVDRLLTEARFAELTSCPDAWYGVRDTGEACSVDAQCAGEAVCERDDEACLGECAEVDSAGSGQCGDIVCRADQYCSTDNNVCQTRRDPGSSCEADHECVRDARCETNECVEIDTGLGSGTACNLDDRLCSFDLVCRQGECGSMPEDGESCPEYGCAGDAYCDDGGTCASRKGAGESCSSDAECSSLRCVDDSCADRDALCPDD
ncbi:MAG: hypothetical protein ACOCV2_00825 [Persicimonas sp.]